jgi:hypothetical protein
MARTPEAQAAHAAQMEQVAMERHAQNEGFYDTAGSLSRAAQMALGIGSAGVVAQERSLPSYHGRGAEGFPPDLQNWKYPGQAPSGLAEERMPRAMHGAQSVYAGKARQAARKVGEALPHYPVPDWMREGNPDWDYDFIKKNAKLYEKWAGDASEAYKMASQAWRTGISPFAERLAPFAGPAGRALGAGTSGAATLAMLPGAMAMSEGGAAGSPFADMHFNAFRLLERPLLRGDVGEEDYAALVNSPEMANDLFEVGAISFDLFQKAGNERVGEETMETQDFNLPRDIADQLAPPVTEYPEEEQLMAAAEELDATKEEAFASMAPIGDFSKDALNSLVDALNKALPLFGAPEDYATFAEDIEGALPTEFVRYLAMTSQAANDANLGRLAVDLENIGTDSDLMKAAGQLDVLAENDSFRTFMASADQETEAPVEEVAEEEVQVQTPISDTEVEAMFVERAR